MMETVKLKPRPCEACSEEDGGKAREIIDKIHLEIPL